MEQPKDKISFLLGTHAHIHENIKFADQKALVVIVLNTGLIGGLYKDHILDGADPFVKIVAISMFLILSLGILFSVIVIRPRGSEIPKKMRGFSNPMKITNWDNAEDYKDGFENSSDEVLVNDLLDFVYSRSTINKKKYFYLKLAILISFIGWVLGLIAILVKNGIIPVV